MNYKLSIYIVFYPTQINIENFFLSIYKKIKKRTISIKPKFCLNKQVENRLKIVKKH